MARLLTRLRDQALDRNRWAYLARSLTACLCGSRQQCPNCGGSFGEQIGRKLLVTRLVRCESCKLLYRIPTDPAAFADDFYQDDYSQGFTTDCPDDTRLSQMAAAEFRGTPKDFSEKLELFKRLNVLPGARILDFGASWGYGTWQMKKAGYRVLGYEPGRSRARYAREKLSVDVIDNESAIEGQFDLVFSSHVLEHVPSPSAVIRSAEKWLRPGGLFLAYTPNGSMAYRNRDSSGYHNHWGMVHPNYLDDQFYREAMSDWQLFLTGTPIDLAAIENWDRRATVVQKMDSWELLVLAVRGEKGQG